MSVFGAGIVYTLIGALKLELAKVLDIGDSKVGGLISALMFTSLFIGLIIGPLVDLFGHKALAMAGFFIVYASVFLLVSVRAYSLAVLACISLGLGGLCLNTVGNTLLPILFFNGHNPPAALNLGNTFFGLGSFITPLFIGMFLKRMGYKITGNIIAAVLLIPVMFAIPASYPQVSGEFSFWRAFGLLTDAMIISASAAFFAIYGLSYP